MKCAHNVLIVEDSIVQAEGLKLMLNSLGINKVALAMDGLIALENFGQALLSGSPYSLVFLDIIMPKMDGQEALRRMRAMEKDNGVSDANKSVIIMTTALGSPKDMMDALLEGDCTDYIVKPVEEEVLLAVIDRHTLQK